MCSALTILKAKRRCPPNFGNHPAVIKMLTDQSKQDCLFIGLRILDEPYSNQESIDFLNQIASDPNDRFRHKFVLRIIQVDKSDDFEDALEKLAVGEVYPWLLRYRLFIVPANVILLVIFGGMFYTLRKYYKKVSSLSTNELPRGK